jgi:hypothetical protein
LAAKSIAFATIPIDFAPRQIDFATKSIHFVTIPIDFVTIPIHLATKSIDFASIPIDFVTIPIDFVTKEMAGAAEPTGLAPQKIDRGECRGICLFGPSARKESIRRFRRFTQPGLRPQPKADCPQISPICADFQREGKGQKEKATDSVGTPSFLFAPVYFFPSSHLESVKICVICGFSNSFQSDRLTILPS